MEGTHKLQYSLIILGNGVESWDPTIKGNFKPEERVGGPERRNNRNAQKSPAKLFRGDSRGSGVSLDKPYRSKDQDAHP